MIGLIDDMVSTMDRLKHAIALVSNLFGELFRKNYLTLLLASILTSVFSLLMLKALQSSFTDEAFSQWLLLQRLLSFVVPFMACGMGVTLAKEFGRMRQLSDAVGLHGATPDEADQYAGASLMRTGVFLLIFGACLLVLTVFIFQAQVNLYVLNTDLLLFALPFAFATALLAILMAAMRGYERFLFSESSRLLIVGFGMLVAALLCSELGTFLWVSTLLNACVCMLFLWRLPTVFSGKFKPSIAIKSVQRIFGDVAGPLLLIIPVLYVKYNIGLAAAGVLSLQILWMNVLLVLVNPLSIMLLPRSRELVSGDHRALRLSLSVLSITSGLVIMGIYFLGGVLYNAAFDIASGDSEFYLLGLAVFFNVIYVISRSLIDGRYQFPIIAYILFAGLVLESGLYIRGFESLAGLNSPVLPYVIASAFIALCCLWMVMRSSNEITN